MATRSITRATFACVLLSVGMLAHAAAGDVYDKAVANPARSANDVKRDKIDHPAELLRLAGIKPGARVLDFLTGDGYYSELLSYVVGPTGSVVMLNNAAFEGWSEGGAQKRIANKRLPNVESRIADVNKMDLAPGSFDAILVIKVYHDLYWVDPKGTWPKIDVPVVLDQLARALKPGGVLLLVDHSAKAGRGNADAGSTHRIEETFARKDFESRGLELTAHSDVLRRPDDKRELVSYEQPAFGKTDRFALVFRKR